MADLGTQGTENNAANAAANNGANQTEEQMNAFFDKLEKIFEGRTQKVAKSVAKTNGGNDEDGQELFERWLNKKIGESTKTQNNEELTKSQQKVAELEATILQMNLKEAVVDQMNELEIDGSHLNHVMKFTDFSKATKDGKVSKAELKKALEDMVTEYPLLKKAAAEKHVANTGIKIGVDKDKKPEGIDMDLVRELMGLPIKK